jgi:hypothetical protein
LAQGAGQRFEARPGGSPENNRLARGRDRRESTPNFGMANNTSFAGLRRTRQRSGCRHCVGCDVAGLAATRVSFPLTNTFMEFSLSPDSSVYSKEPFETNFMMYRV